MKRKPIAKTRDFGRTRQHILEVAFKEVFARGFQGVSVDDIVKKTQLTKGAFYHHFPTKLDLGYALVEDVIRPMILERWVRPLDEFKNPIEGILAQMDNLIGKAKPSVLRLGCPLNNLVQEMAPVDPGFKKRLESLLKLWIEEMEKQVERAKLGGYVRQDVNSNQVAHFIVMAHEGFYGLLKGYETPGAFEALYTSLKRYFKTLEG